MHTPLKSLVWAHFYGSQKKELDFSSWWRNLWNLAIILDSGVGFLIMEFPTSCFPLQLKPLLEVPVQTLLFRGGG